MSHRKTFSILTATAVLAALLVTGTAFARNHGDYSGGPCGGPGYKQHEALAPEKRQKFDEIMKQHFDRVQPLREQMWAKRTELNALSKNPNTTPETISKLVQDMSGLRGQMIKERESLRSSLEKEVGISGFGPGRGFGGHGDCGGYGDGPWFNGPRGDWGGCGRR